MSILKLKNLSKSFDGVKALDGLSMEVAERRITALIGPNGSGKTTLFNVVSGFLKPDAGSIYFHKNRIAGLRPDKIAMLGIGRTFQTIRLCPQMSVLQNVALALRFPKGGSLFASLLRSRAMVYEEEQNYGKAIAILKTIGMEHKKDAMSEVLSHGQRRLVEIARCLALEPHLLLLDEPMSGLAPSAVENMKQMIRTLREEGKTILFIEHNLRVVMDIAENVVVLNYGRKIAEGTPADIRSNPDVITAYLGRGNGDAP